MMNCGGLFGMAPAWYGVTNAPVNLATQYALGNHGYTTNWGGETQFNMFPSYMTGSQMAGTKSLMGQFSLPSYNLNMLAANCTPQEQQGLANSYAQGFARGTQIALDLNIKNTQGVISELKTLLTNNAKDKNLSSLQRDAVIEVLAQVEDAQHRLETTNLLRKEGAPDTAVKESVNAIKRQIAELQKDSAVLTEELQKELEEACAKKGIDTKDFPKIQGTAKSEQTEKAEETESADAEMHTTDKRIDAMKRKEAKSLCDRFYKAIDGPGTEFNKYEDVLNSLDEDNIVEVMNQWQLTYGKEYGETFIESFLDDSGHYQKRNFGSKILAALEKRAEKAGVNVDEQSTVVKKELDSWWILDKKVIANVNDMLAKIIVAEHPELMEESEEQAA